MVTKSSRASRIKFLAFILLIGSIIFNVLACGSNGHKTPKITKDWTEINWATNYPDFTYQGLAPSCSNAPAGIAFDGRSTSPVAFTSDFTFFVKGGKTNNVVIFLEDGGACWSNLSGSTFCLYQHQYSEDVRKIQSGSGVAPLWGLEGMFDTTQKDNPFKDWYFVYVPYCTGDYHIGAIDFSYPDGGYKDANGNLQQPYGGINQTIRHRGAVNFQVVLQWIKDNFEKPEKILVTGSDSGAYGAIYNFPYVADAFPNSKTYQMGDSGNGVMCLGPGKKVSEVDQVAPASIFAKYGLAADIRPTLQKEWNPILPSIYTKAYQDSIIVDFYTAAATNYPNSRFSQFTREYDANQIKSYLLQNFPLVVYNVLVEENPNPAISTDPAKRAASVWVPRMMQYAKDTANASNYTYYVGLGTSSMVNNNATFYSEQSAGDVLYLDWLKAMFDPKSDAWVNLGLE